MMDDVSAINTFLRTGREIRALEQRLRTMSPRDDDWIRVGAAHRQLIERQQKEIVAAVRAGVDWATVEFALRLHGQHASREFGGGEPTPAEQLLELMRRYDALTVVQALDWAHRERVDGSPVDGSVRIVMPAASRG
jgi:hypothetical protein